MSHRMANMEEKNISNRNQIDGEANLLEAAVRNEGNIISEEYWKGLQRRQRKDRSGILLDGVNSRAAYHERYSYGLKQAVTYLMSLEFEELCSPRALRKVHQHLFGGVLKNAGQFRTHSVVAGTGGMPTDFMRIEIECGLLCTQVLGLKIQGDLPPEYSILKAAAFLHLRGKAIQPFVDGNKRTTRLLSSILIAGVLGNYPSWKDPGQGDTPAPSYKRYVAALKSALTPRYEETEKKPGALQKVFRMFSFKEEKQRVRLPPDLTPMVNLLAEGMGLPPSPVPIPSNYRLRPFLDGYDFPIKDLSMKELLELSKKDF